MINVIIQKCIIIRRQFELQIDDRVSDVCVVRHNGRHNCLRPFNSVTILTHIRRLVVPNVSANSVDSSQSDADNSDIENVDKGANRLSVGVQQIDGTDRPLNDELLTVWQRLRRALSNKFADKERETVRQKEIEYRERVIADESETGFDRIKRMFNEYLNGEDCPEMNFVMSSSGFGGIIGGVLGGIFGTRTTTQDFIRRHNEHVFRGQYEGKRKLADTMYLEFFRHGLKSAWRMALFLCMFTTLGTSAMAYRNDVYFRDFMAAGFVTCAVWKTSLGLKAMAVSGVVGSLLGAFYAGTFKLMLWAVNTTVPEYRHYRRSIQLKHVTPKKYDDGSTEYKWDLQESSDRNSSDNDVIKTAQTKNES